MLTKMTTLTLQRCAILIVETAGIAKEVSVSAMKDGEVSRSRNFSIVSKYSVSQEIDFLKLLNPVRGRASRPAIVSRRPGVLVLVEGKSYEPPKIMLFSKFIGR